MEFTPLGVRGAALVLPQRLQDERGFFARVYCGREFDAAGLPSGFVQSSVSYNARRGTVRGMHFQWPPSREGKLVRCVRGALVDVLVDLRPGSPTFLRHAAVRLDEEGRTAVYIPHGVAHGFQTLVDHTEVLYSMTDWYAPDLAGGFRWDDAAFGIDWPIREQVVISARDAAYPDFEGAAFAAEYVRRTEAVS
jgi:dTDP-4-dehydrorhamnose 3,5-epimerase